MNRKVYRILIGFLMVCSNVTAATYYVATNGNDSAAGTSASVPFLTISNAIASAQGVNDTIWVSNGVYMIDATITNPAAKACQICAWSTNAADTMLQGPGSNDVANFRGVLMEGSGSLLQGFTVADFYLTNLNAGAGIYCDGGIISNCVITGNQLSHSATPAQGAGIYMRGSAVLLDCDVIGNTNYHTVDKNFHGGGLFAGTGCQIRRCRFLYNRTKKMGGGIAAYTPGVSIHDCIVAHNEAESNGGIFGGKMVSNCLIYANTADYYGGIGTQAAQCKQISIIDCVVSNNYSLKSCGGVSIMGGYETNALIYRCKIVNNLCDYAIGGGLFMKSATTKCVVRNCLIANNRSNARWGWQDGIKDYGVGVHADGPNVVIENCTIASNVLTRTFSRGGGGLRALNGVCVNNSIIYHNTHKDGGWTNVSASADCTFSNCCTTPLAAIAGGANIEADPQFVSRETANFHLKGTSPCINAGQNQTWMTKASDLDGLRRIYGDSVDIGAYEYLISGTLIQLQ